MTWQGKLFGAGVILSGVIFLAMPITSVGNHFTRVWEERQMYLLVEGIRQQLVRQGISPNDVRSAFDQVDVDGDGQIDGDEFSSFVTGVLMIKMSRAELHKLWRSLDIDGLGYIDFNEFTATLFPSISSMGTKTHQASTTNELLQETGLAPKADDSFKKGGSASFKTKQVTENVTQSVSDAIEEKMADFDAKLQAMHATLMAVHEGVRSLESRTDAIDERLSTRSVARRSKRRIRAGAKLAALKDRPSGLAVAATSPDVLRSFTSTPSGDMLEVGSYDRGDGERSSTSSEVREHLAA